MMEVLELCDKQFDGEGIVCMLVMGMCFQLFDYFDYDDGEQCFVVLVVIYQVCNNFNDCFGQVLIEVLGILCGSDVLVVGSNYGMGDDVLFYCNYFIVVCDNVFVCLQQSDE